MDLKLVAARGGRSRAKRLSAKRRREIASLGGKASAKKKRAKKKKGKEL